MILTVARLLAGVVTGVSIAILILLFLIQQFGTGTIGYAFAPVVTIWLAFNSVLGVYNIAKYDPSIFRASFRNLHISLSRHVNYDGNVQRTYRAT